jgi:plasmid stability protein
MSSKMIQVRNVPDALHRKLKARAALQGLSLSDYLLGEIRRVAEQPTIEEIWDRIKQRGSVELTVNPADLIREDRDSR